jgi:hypothetical protein
MTAVHIAQLGSGLLFLTGLFTGVWIPLRDHRRRGAGAGVRRCMPSGGLDVRLRRLQ